MQLTWLVLPLGPKPLQYGIEEFPDLKSEALPLKFQRSVNSPVPLILSFASFSPHGAPICRVTMELSSQPSKSWPGAFLPGIRRSLRK